MPCWCIRKRLLDVAEVFQCLENKPLETFVVCIIVFDQIWSTFLLILSIIFHFLVVEGNSFVHAYFLSSFAHIYHYRRYQPWELDPDTGAVADVIDWDEDRIQINKSRELMDELCSDYEGQIRIPGDPGDYLKEVAGRPNSSLWNYTLKTSTILWLVAIFIVYFTTPSVLIAVWWRRRRGEIVGAYIFLQTVALFFLIAVCFILRFQRIAGRENGSGRLSLMCGLDVIFGGKPVRTYIYIFTGVFGCYQLVKYMFFEMYVIEMHLLRKRKDYGFRKTLAKVEMKHTVPDVEKQIAKDKKIFDRIGGEKSKTDVTEGTVSTKRLAREMLEIGESTAEEMSSSSNLNIKDSKTPTRNKDDARKKKIKRLSKAMRNYSKMVRQHAEDISMYETEEERTNKKNRAKYNLKVESDASGRLGDDDKEKK